MRLWVGVALFLVLAGLVFGAFLLFSHSSHYGSLCELAGGKWASVRGECITRSCYRQGSCGLWANPGERCNLLHVGDPVSEVYFQLGEPHVVRGDDYEWWSHKAESEKVVIHLKDEKVASLVCNHIEDISPKNPSAHHPLKEEVGVVRMLGKKD